MKFGVIPMILGSVTLSAIAQMAMKSGMSSNRVQVALEQGENRLNAISAVVTSGGVILGLTLYFVGAVVWLLVLARVDVSYAYPSSVWVLSSRWCLAGYCLAKTSPRSG